MERPRLRGKGAGAREVAIPAYARLRAAGGQAQRISDILVAGISKSALSRQFVQASASQLAALQERRWDKTELLAIYIDGIVVDRHHIVAAIGVDERGDKHLLGLSSGATENARVVKDLLQSLIERGLSPDRSYLFVIDGSKALRAAIEALLGEGAPVQRCRTHKVRNVVERLPKALAAQVKAVMHAPYRLDHGHHQTAPTGQVVAGRASGCGGVVARGCRRNVHGESARIAAFVAPVSGVDQLDRES